MNPTDALVVLRGGVSVAAPAYLLLLDFEARGISLAKTDAGMLSVGPADQLTDADRVTLRAYKPHLLMLLEYMQRPDLDAHLFTDRPREVTHA